MKKLILMGTSDFVVPIFESLRQKHNIISVFTRAPKPAGRKQVITPSPVQIWAESHGLSVHNSIREFDNADADFVIVMSYGVIIKDDVLDQGNFINIHPSDLPRYRGPSPIRTAIKNGDTHGAVCLMKLAHDVDAGDVFMRREFDIDLDDTYKTVEDKVDNIAIKMLDEFLANPAQYKPIPQVGTPIMSYKINSSDEIIDWSKPAIEIHNLVRAYGSGRTKINGIDVKILKTKITDGNLNILEIQPSGKKPMDWKSFVNGLHGAEIKYGE